MRKFLSNFWVCLGLALFCSYQAAAAYTPDATGWTWMLGICALMWLNDARRALKRDKEALDEQDSGTEEG